MFGGFLTLSDMVAGELRLNKLPDRGLDFGNLIEAFRFTPAACEGLRSLVKVALAPGFIIFLTRTSPLETLRIDCRTEGVLPRLSLEPVLLTE